MLCRSRIRPGLFVALALPILCSPIPAAGHSEKHEASPRAETGAITNLSVPDVELVDQHGKRVRFYSDLVQGHVVGLSFIYTQCTTVCGLIGVNVARLQELVDKRPGPDVRFISISIDPANDTPEHLKAWSEKFKAGPDWTLVTGPKPEVDRLLKALTVFTPLAEDHAPLFLVGNDATGQWRLTSGLAPAAQIAEMIEQLY